MSYKQIRNFDPSKMGTQPNYCLRNCRIGYDPEIPPKYADAKEAMLANKNAGTLHDMSTRPTNCAVPVFADTPSSYEHVMVWDKNTLYSDGKAVDPSKFKYFGWGESLNDVKVVEYIPDPAPTPAPELFKVGDKVVPIKLVSYDGIPLVQYDDYYVITQLIVDRAVLSAKRGDHLEVWAAMNINNIRKV